ncbi:hypothetical protein KAW80_00215 [Candidatus Babeliales bacterium]|nr:hypothetical protein [Candidatus Babeliales bacterium]
MTHWGWYWKVKKKHNSRNLCSDLLQIDSFKFFKENTILNFKVSPLEVKAKATPNNLEVSYRNHKNCSYSIGVEKLPCNYGGFRYFFKCPLYLKRMQILYLAEQSVFLCGKCLNLTYEIQQKRSSKRYDLMRKPSTEAECKG